MDAVTSRTDEGRTRVLLAGWISGECGSLTSHWSFAHGVWGVRVAAIVLGILPFLHPAQTKKDGE
jgi:hypothetical protein